MKKTTTNKLVYAGGEEEPFDPATFDETEAKRPADYINVSRLRRRLPAQAYKRREGGFFAKLDVGTTLLATNTATGQTLQWAVTQSVALLEGLAQAKNLL